MTQFYDSLYDIVFSFSFKTLVSQVLKKIFTIFTLYTLYKTNPYAHQQQISISPDLINKLCIFLDEIQDKRPSYMNKNIKQIIKAMFIQKIFLIGVVQGCKTVSFDRNGRPCIKKSALRNQEGIEQLQADYQQSFEDQANFINIQQNIINYNPLKDEDWIQSLNFAQKDAQEYNQQKFEALGHYPEMLRVQKNVMRGEQQQQYQQQQQQQQQQQLESQSLTVQEQKEVWQETRRIYKEMNQSDTSLIKTAQRYDSKDG